MEELVKYMKALVALQLQLLNDPSERAKPEVLLANAGFTQKEIGGLVGKSTAAVQKAVERAKKAAGAA